MSQEVAPIFNAVATPFCAKVRLPVFVPPASVMVSELMAIVMLLAFVFTNVIAVPIGYATEAFAAIVKVMEPVDVKRCLPESAATVT
jgi:hypothetical protein